MTKKKANPIAQQDTIQGLSARMAQALVTEREKAQLAAQFKIDLNTTPAPIPQQSSSLNTLSGLSLQPYSYSTATTMDPTTLVAHIRQAQAQVKAAHMTMGVTPPRVLAGTTGLKIPDMFSGDLDFLSNAYLFPFEVPWLHKSEDPDDATPSIADSAEHAYQASKSLRWNEQQWILAQSSPDAARERGQSAALVPQSGWDRGLRMRFMMKILNLKFSPGSDLGDRLVDTGDIYLRNTNEYHDQYWGSCMCAAHYGVWGANMLGELLMVRRETLRLLKE